MTKYKVGIYNISGIYGRGHLSVTNEDNKRRGNKFHMFNHILYHNISFTETSGHVNYYVDGRRYLNMS